MTKQPPSPHLSAEASAKAEAPKPSSPDAPEATLISVILDRSGSMESLREPTIAGFNEFLLAQQQQKDGGSALMSLTQFDDRYEVNFVGEPIANVPELDTNSYVPRGSTALYDAIGRTIHELEAWTSANDWKQRVLVLIVTDGQENASGEYTFEAARALIAQKEKDGWNFAYMGAKQDAYAVGGSLNVRQDFSANYAATPAGTAAVFDSLKEATTRFRTLKQKGAAVGRFFGSPDLPNEADSATGKLKPTGAGVATADNKPAPLAASGGNPGKGRLRVKQSGH